MPLRRVALTVKNRFGKRGVTNQQRRACAGSFGRFAADDARLADSTTDRRMQLAIKRWQSAK
jgi:hypothetical protein